MRALGGLGVASSLLVLLAFACADIGGLSGGGDVADAACGDCSATGADAAATASIELTAAPARVVLDTGDTKRVDLAVVRRGGVSGPIAISVNGLPSGVTATPLTIVDLAGSLELSAAPPAAGPTDVDLEIVGTSGGVVGTTRVHLRVGSLLHVATPDGGASYTVPAGIDSLRFKVWGAGGGGTEIMPGGGGGFVQADLQVTPGEALDLVVGTGGGGTAHNPGPNSDPGAGGGGYSAVRRGNALLVVAGGGGGGGGSGSPTSTGGAGGGDVGESAQGAGGGTALAGGAPAGDGATAGASLQGGVGGCGAACNSGANGGVPGGGAGGLSGSPYVNGGGGGGGGWFGGGGGSANGGGGGSGGVAAGATNVVQKTGAGQKPAAMTDPDYAVSVGWGGGTGALIAARKGLPGRVVVLFPK